jgi:hypothetical protein
MSFERRGPPTWLERHWDELRLYVFQWVAATDDGLIAHHPDLTVLMQEVLRLENDGRPGLSVEAVYAFVEELVEAEEEG